MHQTERPLEIGMLLYPELTLLDLIGPQTVFSWFANTHLAWKTMDPVISDTGIGIQPTCTFETCPSELDILFVPGGFGQQKLMGDAQVLAFLANRARKSEYITSVCSGSLLLGAAGLLKGYKATSHWAMRDGLTALERSPLMRGSWLIETGSREAGSPLASILDWCCSQNCVETTRRS
jgi:cyclohexyl-isocyanide hydratase